MPHIEFDIPESHSADAEKILAGCAASLESIGHPISTDELMALMVDQLAKKSGEHIVRYVRLGKILQQLSDDYADEQRPKGTYGVGKAFIGTMNDLDKAQGRTTNDDLVEDATNKLLDNFLTTLFRLAGVER